MLPSHNSIHERLLFAGSSAQIDTGGFYAFVSHQVCKQRNVILTFQEVLGVTMSERVRIDNLLIKAIFVRIVFQLL